MTRQLADFEATKNLPEGQIPQELIDKLMGGDPRSHFEKAMNEMGSMITLDNQVLGFMKFFDSDLPDSHLDSYYMEREWRVQGNVRFEADDVACLWAPSEYVSDLASRLPALKSKIRTAP